METKNATRFARITLLSNGLVDLLAAIALFFPVFSLPLPGYGNYPPELKFIAGGWAVAALTFGIGRIWTSAKPNYYRLMLTLGLIEGGILTIFCVFSLLFVGITWLQAMFPLFIGSIWGILYLVAMTGLGKIKE